MAYLESINSKPPPWESGKPKVIPMPDGWGNPAPMPTPKFDGTPVPMPTPDDWEPTDGVTVASEKNAVVFPWGNCKWGICPLSSESNEVADVNVIIENFNIYIDNKEPVYLVPPEAQETPDPDFFQA